MDQTWIKPHVGNMFKFHLFIIILTWSGFRLTSSCFYPYFLFFKVQGPPFQLPCYYTVLFQPHGLSPKALLLNYCLLCKYFCVRGLESVSVEVSVEADDFQVCNFASPACLKEQRGRKEGRLGEKERKDGRLRALNSKARGTRKNAKSVEIKWTKVKKMWRGGGES